MKISSYTVFNLHNIWLKMYYEKVTTNVLPQILLFPVFVVNPNNIFFLFFFFFFFFLSNFSFCYLEITNLTDKMGFKPRRQKAQEDRRSQFEIQVERKVKAHKIIELTNTKKDNGLTIMTQLLIRVQSKLLWSTT